LNLHSGIKKEYQLSEYGEIQQIKKRITPIISLSDEEFQLFCDVIELKTLAKNEFFMEEGRICDYIGLVNQGVMIYFKSMDNGNEITTDFAFEGDWVTVNQSRLSNSPSLINITAIENSELLVIKQQDLSDLYIKIPKIKRLGQILMEQAYLKIVQQSVDLQVLTATDRYENLLQQFPEIFQRVQLYHIARQGIRPTRSLNWARDQFD